MHNIWSTYAWGILGVKVCLWEWIHQLAPHMRQKTMSAAGVQENRRCVENERVCSVFRANESQITHITHTIIYCLCVDIFVYVHSKTELAVFILDSSPSAVSQVKL